MSKVYFFNCRSGEDDLQERPAILGASSSDPGHDVVRGIRRDPNGAAHLRAARVVHQGRVQAAAVRAVP